MDNTLYVFDIDGTLTPSRGCMPEQFANYFRKFFADRRYAFVTGSDYDKVCEQLPADIVGEAQAVFCCSGNNIWVGGAEIHRSDWTPGEDLIMFLENELLYSTWEHPTSNHIEQRTGLVNFSTVGRACDQATREHYRDWDAKNKEREHICKRIKRQFPELEAQIGGEISIDIYPLGADKSQIINHLGTSTIHFFGDGMSPGRNDYPLAQVLEPPHQCFSVGNWQDTLMYLINIDLNSLKTV